LAALLDDEELERVVAEANYRRRASDAELRSQLERNPKKRGNARLRRVLDLPGGPRRTRSPAERALLRLLRERGAAGLGVMPVTGRQIRREPDAVVERLLAALGG
jgi:hypothetical protein